ncbi:MAG TPA: SCP2 sterol-binding domain-containing protein [Spirochaetota bacterium]|nr:SCP2 sterol-binding domain-containing protein [Spirochaetota bacterium]OPZ36617.1 MAG: SCP-2 sterol transfer family protein [Spirochaetes bacterium ADurb.BinA120]HNU92982.1 SCP2 sterol-binding domain-containing protein [Spirochaetota bacterium]HPI14374.1 SCP2 sterol-binding domain-containing protein [Spirochaetota bacterium]HPV99255.1 SCP2 sterol-binding domain-containing protein [Spirochaetota bacterium]
MSQTVKYLSPQWRDEAEKRLKSELSPEKMNNITSSMSNIYNNCPDGKNRYLFFKFEDGNFAELSIGEGEPPKAEFRISGDYQVFAKISRAELGSQKALMTGRLKLKGNMIKALKLASIADRLNKVLSKIPAEY